LLVTIVGANTGDVGPVIEDRREHYVCQSVALIRPANIELTPYLNLWFNSPGHGHRYFEGCIYGAGRPHLSFLQLKAAPVAVPSLAEQGEIVRRVERLLSVTGQLEDRIKAAMKRVEQSSQAVLVKAFRGDLISADAEQVGEARAVEGRH
jgi:type I restriction enzyme S subunit